MNFSYFVSYVRKKEDGMDYFKTGNHKRKFVQEDLMTSNQQTPEKFHLLTLKEAAEYLRMHKGSLYRLLENGDTDLPAIKLGGKWLFNLESLNQYLMNKEQKK